MKDNMPFYFFFFRINVVLGLHLFTLLAGKEK